MSLNGTRRRGQSNLIGDDLSIGRLEQLKLTGNGGVYVSIPRHEFDWLVEQAKQNILKGIEDSKLIRSYLTKINPGDKLQVNPPTGMKLTIQGRGTLYWEGIEMNTPHKLVKF